MREVNFEISKHSIFTPIKEKIMMVNKHQLTAM
jgi:hypothetical protein